MNRDTKNFLGIFSVIFLTRWLYAWVTGNDHFSLFGDSYRYDMLSDRILAGNFNLDVTAFIIAPLYPWTLALMKWLFGMNWIVPTAALQYGIVSMSGIYAFRFARTIFNSESIGWIAVTLYCCYPMTLHFHVLFTQEAFFQSFFLIFLYYWHQALYFPGKYSAHKAGLFFALAFLTKSHAALLAPFLVLVHLFIAQGNYFQRLKPAVIIGAWAFMLNLPFALINVHLNNTWTWSSGGIMAFFHNAHSPETYQTTFFPNFESVEARVPIVNLGFIFDTAYVYPIYGKVNALPQPERDRLHGKIALEWIRNNFRQFLELKLFSLKRFFLPGASKKHYRFDLWLKSVLVSLPVYLFGYIGLVLCLRTNFKSHIWALAVVFMMLFLYMVFPPQARFRTITLEPVYILYAALGVAFFYNKITARFGGSQSAISAKLLG